MLEHIQIQKVHLLVIDAHLDIPQKMALLTVHVVKLEHMHHILELLFVLNALKVKAHMKVLIFVKIALKEHMPLPLVVPNVKNVQVDHLLKFNHNHALYAQLELMQKKVLDFVMNALQDIFH